MFKQCCSMVLNSVVFIMLQITGKQFTFLTLKSFWGVDGPTPEDLIYGELHKH